VLAQADVSLVPDADPVMLSVDPLLGGEEAGGMVEVAAGAVEVPFGSESHACLPVRGATSCQTVAAM
jgi:hypothetical protein